MIVYIFLCETNTLMSPCLFDHIIHNLCGFNTYFKQNINLCLIWITYCSIRPKELCVDSIDQIMIMFSYKFLYNPLSIFSIQAYTKCSFTSNSSQRSWLMLWLVIFNKLCRSMSFSGTHPLSIYYISILVSLQIIFSNTKFGYFG